MMTGAGKGDKQRPMQIPQDKYKDNWDNIFKNKKLDTQKKVNKPKEK